MQRNLKSLIITIILITANFNEGSCAFTHNDALKYLRKYKYLTPQWEGRGSPASSADMRGALMRFQQMMGIPQTGELDTATKDLMSSPRCGVSDFAGKREKRYALAGSKWKNNEISYKVVNYPSTSHVSQYAVDSVVERSFQLWEKQTALRFKKVAKAEKADIEVTFARGDHRDGFPFDGKGGDLAHAFFPAFGGDVHFDDAEKWDNSQNQYGYKTGTNLFHVASHEIGHSLGLAHSDKRDSIMYAVYKQKNVLKLHRDDILGIQMLYGMPSVPPTGTQNHHYNLWGTQYTTPRYYYWQRPPMQSMLCADPRIDAITRIREYGQTNTYVFKGPDIWMLNKDGIVIGYPQSIGSRWPTLPSYIDAALYVEDNEKTFIFKGAQYWRISEGRLDPGYPKSITFFWPGTVTHIDAAFRWSGNGQTYFIKGDRYWRVGAQFDYPRPLSKWKGLPSKIDAAFQWKNGKTYFFSGTGYYRFNDYTLNVDNSGFYEEPPYPRDNAKWWFGCDGPASMRKEDRKSPWCEVDRNGKVDCNGSEKCQNGIVSVFLVNLIALVLLM